MSNRTALDIAVDRQGHYESYFVALSFTILGLAVQSAHLGQWVVADLFELLGWAALMIAGLRGLRRLEQLPEHYRVQDLRNRQEEKQRVAAEGAFTNPGARAVVAVTGKEVLLSQYAAEAGAEIPKIDARLQQLSGAAVKDYRWQKRCFAAGLVSLAVGRSIPAIAHSLGLLGIQLH